MPTRAEVLKNIAATNDLPRRRSVKIGFDANGDLLTTLTPILDAQKVVAGR